MWENYNIHITAYYAAFFLNANVVQKCETRHLKNAIAISENAVVIPKMQLSYQNAITFQNDQFYFFEWQLYF